ncbi:MAG: NapC/NirT family cytochrome c [Candidatus Omnitrophica bacterium]|nr:NapC/NirT family cytochrome c [Candidatus Omnitrophota bacterium]
MAPKPPSLLRNPISLLGIVVASTSTAFGLPMMFIDMFSRRTHPYLGVLVYLVLPFVATGGVALVALGAFWERRRRKRRPGLAIPPLPRIDLNQPAHQIVIVTVLTVVMTIVVLLSITGYRAYHFTESVQFCGIVCHQVMKPEHTAYQYSPHARVACVQCHVGPGADWFVRSKLSGLYQVYATIANKYPRPIPTPVKNLRPAQETCEQCHWPAKFFGAQQKTFRHYLTDETNSPWQIEMLLKIGGGDPKVGAATGIHWHMNIKNDIFYIASDEKREVIPWVRVIGPKGETSEYMSTENPLSPEQVAKAEIRRMDCVDCHPLASVCKAGSHPFIGGFLCFGKRSARIHPERFGYFLSKILSRPCRRKGGSDPARNRCHNRTLLAQLFSRNASRLALLSESHRALAGTRLFPLPRRAS